MQLIKNILSRCFIFGNLTRLIVPFRINLLYWKPKHCQNVGDYLSLIVVEEVERKLNLKKGFTFPTKRLVSIGSVLSFCSSGKSYIWGTGLMNERSADCLIEKSAVLDIRAIRGPKTYFALCNVGYKIPSNVAMGDPAILMPLFFSPIVERIKGKVLIIPHHSRVESYKIKYKNVFDTYTSDWQSFIREILSSEKVISSSLHGIILAESYGVPAVLLGDFPQNQYFKYEDYYQSTGRMIYPIVGTIEEGMETVGQINDNVSKMQEKLLQSFPIDIY